jgi:hypothetical protein
MRRCSFLRKLAIITISSTLSLPVLAAGQAADPQAVALVKAYNARPFGSPGWRRVHLDLKNGETVTRGYDVVNIWQLAGDVVRTVFVLERPESLQGTDYMLLEDPQDPFGMKVFFHLPAGQRRVITILPSNFGEGLLGSDFGYRDLRMRIPLNGYDFHVVGRQTLLGQSVWAVDATPATAEARQVVSWARARYYFAEKVPVLIGADYFAAPTGGSPIKQLRVLGFRQIDGAWTETNMVMTAADGRSSVLTLKDFKARAPEIDPALFQPETLPAATERLSAVGLTVKPRAESGGKP